jgi:hypothetical protein
MYELWSRAGYTRLPTSALDIRAIGVVRLVRGKNFAVLLFSLT